MLLLIFLFCSMSAYASDESTAKYLQYQEPHPDTSTHDDPPSDLIPTTLDETSIGDKTVTPLAEGVTLKVYDKRGLTVSVEGKVILFIKDHITEIRIKKEEEKKDCTIL